MYFLHFTQLHDNLPTKIFGQLKLINRCSFLKNDTYILKVDGATIVYASHHMKHVFKPRFTYRLQVYKHNSRGIELTYEEKKSHIFIRTK